MEGQCRAWFGTFAKVTMIDLYSGEEVGEIDLKQYDLIPERGDYFHWNEKEDPFFVIARVFSPSALAHTCYVTLFGRPSSIGNCFAWDRARIMTDQADLG